MVIKGTVLITDPCYIKNSYNARSISRSTIYGDWSCMVYPGELGDSELPNKWNEKYFKFFKDYNSVDDTDKKEQMRDEYNKFREEWKANILGEFCADGGMVGIFDYNTISDKDKEWCVSHPWCATIIEDFDGDVDFKVINNESVHVIGKGNKPFYSVQSGL